MFAKIFIRFGFCQNKRIVVLGRRGIGKTVLQTYLSKRKWLDEYEATVSPKDLNSRLLFVNGKFIAATDSIDFPGNIDNYGETAIKNIKKSDLILLLLPAKELFEEKESAADEAYAFSNFIIQFIINNDKKNYKTINENQMFFIVGNYFEDKVKLPFSQGKNLATEQDKFGKLESIKTIKKQLENAYKEIEMYDKIYIALGSLASKKSAKTLVENIFAHIN